MLIAPVAAASSDPSSGRERVVRFSWPTQGTLTQYFWQYHPGIDVANDVGTPDPYLTYFIIRAFAAFIDEPAFALAGK